MQPFKNIEQRNTVLHFNNIYDHNNSNEPVQISIPSHFTDTVKFSQVISLNPFITPRERDAEQLLFTIRVNGSLGPWFHKTIHSSSCCCNNNHENSEEEFIELSLGEESHGHMSLVTSQCFASNHGGCESRVNRYQETSHSTSSSCGGLGHRSIMNIHSAALNCGIYVDRGGYMPQTTRHSPSRNQGGGGGN